MALIHCPDCNTLVSDRAINCPNCGYPLKKPKTTIVKEKEGCFSQAFKIGCLIIITIAIITTLSTMYVAYKNKIKNENNNNIPHNTERRGR